MIEHTPEINEIAKALAKVQSAVNGVEKDSINPYFSNRYVSLEGVINAMRGPLGDAGLAFTQAPGAIVAGAVEITTMLIHSVSGQWLRSTLHVPLDKNTAQGVGSAITYGCRYALMATLGVPPLDDDGNGAVAHQKPKAVEAKPEPKPEVKPDTPKPEPYKSNLMAEPEATKVQNDLTGEINGCVEMNELSKYLKLEGTKSRYGRLPTRHRGYVDLAIQARKKVLEDRAVA